jgi:hypothetical protein
MGEELVRDPPDLYARANRAPIADMAGVRLYRSGARLRGECPLCGGSKGKKGDGCFAVDPKQNRWRCFGGCDRGGDAVDFAATKLGLSPREAALRLYDGVIASPPPQLAQRQVAPRQAGAGPTDRIAVDLWAQATRARGTLVETYLRARLIRGAVLDEALEVLRFHPSAYWGFDEDAGLHIRLPAMIAPLHTPARRLDGIHATYLRDDGAGKTRHQPSKKMWGPQRDEHGRAGGCWLIGPVDHPRILTGRATPVIAGEGIETSLSAAMLFGKACRVVAALSLGALQGGLLTDAWGRLDPLQPCADAERPPFTWPGIDRVIVAVDRDMKPVKVKVRRMLGGTIERQLDGEERARICASLAEQAWRRAGARHVSSMAPAAGRDFNDELRAAQG